MPISSFSKRKGKSIMSIAIHNIGGYIMKNYLLETPIGVVAIDTGYPGGFRKFKEQFEKKWPLSALKYIFLTHHHDDHSGFLNELIIEIESSRWKKIQHQCRQHRTTFAPYSVYSLTESRAIQVRPA